MIMQKMNRRSFLYVVGAGLALETAVNSARAAEAAGSTLPPWQPGMLDIHHISTGRGNAALFICPDGTSIMVDAGAIYETLEYTIAPKPDASRRPGEWLGRYVRRHLTAAGRNEIDYFVLTHFHTDHMGAMAPDLPLASDGTYRLTGVADVAEIVPIRRYIDRDYPGYTYPAPLNDPHQQNYRAFIAAQRRRGTTVEKFKPGSQRQIRLLRRPSAYPNFEIRNLAANGEVWTGVADGTRRLFPDSAVLRREDYPSENMCSLAMRLSYGAFDYYTGGDLTCSDNYGDDPWRDIETPVARVAGAVDVAVVNHHGYADACGPDFVRALRPRAFVIEAWDSAHPVVSTLGNMTSRRLYPAERDIYATAMKAENRIANRAVAGMRSENGHVIVRVSPGGRSFAVVVTDNTDEKDRVTASYGPFACA
jgi:beta-lactamase superfamily II metal-dependent hydrolase